MRIRRNQRATKARRYSAALAACILGAIVVLAIFNFLPVGRILPSYAEELIFLLLGANILSTAWTRWGLDRRIALVSLIGVGTSTRRQIVVWFAIATVLSAFLPNTVVAAAMIPIVLAMLRFIGIDEIGKSEFSSALVITRADARRSNFRAWPSCATTACSPGAKDCRSNLCMFRPRPSTRTAA